VNAQVTAAPPERRTSSVELLWDLVFVFAVTQVTTLLSRHLSWAGFGHAVIVLALVWWAWSAFVWAVNAQAEDARTLRVVLLVSAAFIFISGLALPEAFGASGPLFAVTYAVVRLLHLALYTDAARRGRASFSAIAGFGLTVLLGMALLIIASLFDGGARVILWSAAVLIDYAGPAWLTRERLRSLQRVAVAHFAERYSLFVIICLGESIVAIGVGAASTHRHLSAELVAVVSLGLLITIGMWWTYFDRLEARAELSLGGHRDPVLAAADGYSYLHLVIIAGIIIFAVGVRLLVHNPAAVPIEQVRLALCGGVAVYLTGNVLFAWRVVGSFSHAKAIAAVAALVLYAVGGGMSAIALTSVLGALLALLCVAEAVIDGRADDVVVRT
jgi:low temperature requirement protein LtrA